MGWFKVTDGRVVCGLKLSRDPFAAWTATREGSAAIAAVAGTLRFRLFGKVRAARRQVWRGTLSDLADGRAHVAGNGPALIVIGKVAALDVAGVDSVDDALSAHTAVAARARRTR